MAERSYTELVRLRTFQERFEYLQIGNGVGDESFGWRRYLNQVLYTLPNGAGFATRSLFGTTDVISDVRVMRSSSQSLFTI